MPSRRRVLAGSGIALAGLVGGRGLVGGSRSSQPGLSAARSTEFDWPMARYDAAGTGFNPEASGPRDDVRVKWKREPEATVSATAPPILVGDALFAVGRRSVVALERETGRVRFSRSGSYLSAPARAEASAYRNDTLAVSGREGVYGLNAGGGYELLGRSIGAKRWHGPGREPAGRTSANPGEPSPVAAGETVYAIVPETDQVVAFDANSGGVRWRYALGDEHTSGTHRPAVRDGTVYVSSSAGDVAALDAETGDEHWSVTLERGDGRRVYDLLAPTATGEGLVVPGRSTVWLLDSRDGDVLWEYRHGGNVTEGSAAVADGVVFVTDGDESLHAIELDSGDEGYETWTTDYPVQTSPVVADGVVYLGYHWLDELVAVDAETGDRRWTYETDRIGFSQPIVGDGVLYVVETDRVVALEEEP